MTKKLHIVAIIQARMGSSRLPGKTMMDLAGKPLLDRVLTQVAGSSMLDEIIVATSTEQQDNAIEAYVNQKGFRCIRGSKENVLSRYFEATQLSHADVIVRITADCPLHSPDTIDEVVSAFIAGDYDYASNTNPYTRPDGQDVEVFSRLSLELAVANAGVGPDQEHVTPWIRRATGLQKLDFMHPKPHLPTARWSVDYPDDLDFACKIWEVLDQNSNGPFNFEEIMSAISKSNAQQGSAVINEGFYLSIFNDATAEAAAPLKMEKSEDWLAQSNKVIPGGAQTYSKSWRHHIRGVTPIFLEDGKGAMVNDVDGNSYVDLIQGLLPNILGYANDEVNNAVIDCIKQGHSFSLPHPLEVQLATRLCDLIPCAEMVRFGKNGSDATAGAVRVARAFTDREHVAICGYHGWQDWFIGTTSRSHGVPNGVKELSHTFPYHDLEALEQLLASKPNKFAAVIMEPVNFHWPSEGYLEAVKELAHKHGALLIFDEICSGFHFGLGGAQKILGVTPDLATFGKAMGNGWPISCVVGRKDVMKVFEDAFFSFTFAGDNAAMAASMKVLDILEHGDAYARITAAGSKLFDGAKVLAKAAGLESNFQLDGNHRWALFNFLDDERNEDVAMRSLWIQEVTRRGVLILTTFNICSALDEGSVTTALKAFAHAFKRVADVKSKGHAYEDYLDGPLPIPAFRARG
jgi:glutamate-1-semialdehyde 2,1-aminomutase/spore coat polysaccharide biosynthesis protein SpsF